MMKRCLKNLTFSLLGVLLLVPVVSGSSGPISASGTFVVIADAILSVQSFGGVTVLKVTHVSQWTGTFKGKSVINDETIIIFPNGMAIDRGTGKFVTDDGTGTADHAYIAVGSIGPDGLYGTADDTETGVYIMDNGTGSLAGVEGHGSFTGVFGGTYDGLVSFKNKP
jgi:hypothetical protein